MAMVRLALLVNGVAVFIFVWREWFNYWTPLYQPLARRLDKADLQMVRHIRSMFGKGLQRILPAPESVGNALPSVTRARQESRQVMERHIRSLFGKIGDALPGDRFKAIISEELQGAQTELESIIGTVRDNFHASDYHLAEESSQQQQLYDLELIASTDDHTRIHYIPPPTHELVDLIKKEDEEEQSREEDEAVMA
eukprot:5933014-Prymnesium_polylepis.1